MVESVRILILNSRDDHAISRCWDLSARHAVSISKG